MKRDIKQIILAYFDLGFRTGDTLSMHSNIHVADMASKKPEFVFACAAPRQRLISSVKMLIGIVVACLIALALWFFDSEMIVRDVVSQPNVKFLQVPIVHILGILIGVALLLGVAAFLLHFLQQFSNQLYWELACWFLVVIGIIVRQMVVNGSSDMTIGEILVSAVVGVAVLPWLMRWLNKISKKPGLQHVSVPFSLGFFVDLAQVLTSHYIVRLPWIPM